MIDKIYDHDFECLKESLQKLYSELSQILEENEFKSIIDVKTDVLRFGNIHAFMEKPLNHLFFFYSIKSILYSLIIIKDRLENTPEYNKQLKEIFINWGIK